MIRKFYNGRKMENGNFDLIKSCPLELNLNTHAANECRRPD